MAETQKTRRATITFREETFTINAPDEGQALALVLVNKGGLANDVKMGVISDIMVTCMGAANWSLFLSGLATKKYDGASLMELITAVLETVKDKAESVVVADPFGG